MKDSVRDREFDKFRSSENNLSKVAVTMEGDSGLLQGIEYNDIQVTYPTNETELYSYYLGATLKAQIEVTYTNLSKQDLLRVRRL